MASDRPDPSEFFEMAQRMLREFFGEQRSDDDPWAEATRRSRERSGTPQGNRELSPERQRENLTFALATRGVEALEDLALNVAAIRQRLERTDPKPAAPKPAAPKPAAPEPPAPEAEAEAEGRGPDGADAAG